MQSTEGVLCGSIARVAYATRKGTIYRALLHVYLYEPPSPSGSPPMPKFSRMIRCGTKEKKRQAWESSR